MDATSKPESMSPKELMSPKPCIALGLDYPAGITDLPIEILENIAGHLTFKGRTRFMTAHPMIHHKLAEYLLFDAVQNHLPRTIIGNVFDGRLRILKVLQSKGARFDARYGSDNPRRYDPEYPLKHRRDRIMLCRPDPEMAFLQTFQALHLAILRGHDDIVAWLVNEVKVPVNEPCKGISSLHSYFAPIGNAQMPLALAIREERPSVVELLLKKGASLYTDYCTPLQLAVVTGCRETVRVVLEHARGDIDAVNVVARSALSIAADISPKCVRLLVNAGASLTTECAFGKHPDWERDWLVDPIRSGNRLLPLHIAAMNDDPDAVIALLEAGADVNRLSSGFTALHCALRNRHCHKGPRLETIKALLKGGADPNIMLDHDASVDEWTSDSGVTQLMHAALETPFPEVIELLLRHGADAKAVDSSGRTALHWLLHIHWDARHSPRELGPALVLLLRYGCDPKKTDDNGECALQLAARDMHRADYPGWAKSHGLDEPLWSWYREQDTLVRLLVECSDGKPCCCDNKCLNIALERCLECYHDHTDAHEIQGDNPDCYNTAMSLIAAGAVLSKQMIRRACRSFLKLQPPPAENDLWDSLYAVGGYRPSQVDPLHAARTSWERHRLYFDRMHKLAASHGLFNGGLLKFFLRHAGIRDDGLRAIDRVAADYELNREYYDSNDGLFSPPDDLWDYDEDDAAPADEEENIREHTAESDEFEDQHLHSEEHRGDSAAE